MLWKAATSTTYNLLSICLYVFWIHSIHRTIIGFLVLDTIPIGFLILDTRKYFFQKHLHKVIKILIGTGQAQPCVLVGSTLDFFYNKEVARENRFVTRTSSLNKDFGLKWNFIVVYTVNVFIGHKILWPTREGFYDIVKHNVSLPTEAITSWIFSKAT